MCLLTNITCFILLYMVSSINGHGRLLDPPSRVTAWRYGFNTPREYTDNEYNCGGFSRQWNVNGGKCGVCGDAWDLNPRPSEDGGKYATAMIVKTYSAGQRIEVSIELTANHRGYMEFKLCPANGNAVTQDCLDSNPLQLSDGSGYKFHVGSYNGVYKVKLQLPKDITCKRCVLQWRYQGGNNWGICPDGSGAIGCGPQEEFRACADVTIKNNGDQNPPSGGSITIPTSSEEAFTNVHTDATNDFTITASHTDIGCNIAYSGFIRDPHNCSRFYRCIRTVGGGWKQVPFACPPGLAFNVAIGVCDWSYNVAGC